MAGRGKQSKQSASWDRFAELMTASVTPKAAGRGPRPPRKAAPASARKIVAPAAATTPTVETSGAPSADVIRAWAKRAGLPVKAKGKLAQSGFDAFSAAHG